MIKVESLEIHVSNHCNLSCRGCSHISPLDSEKFVDEQELVKSLKILSKVLHCTVIRLLGGEPTLNPNLQQIVDEISRINISDKIAIATNGIFLNKINDNILKKIDIMEISNYNYSKKTTEKMKDWAKEAKERYDVKTYIYMYKYFREPFSFNKNENDQMVNDIYKSCIVSQKWQCFNIYEGYFFKCPEAMALCKYISECNFENNGIKIIDNDFLEQELDNYLNSEQSLDVCKYCLGTAGKRFEIEQTTKKNYIEKASRLCQELIDEQFLKQCLDNDIRDMKTVEEVIEF